ncbi:hypothetical protein [Halocynthiibacter styelae]|uniref:Lipoprotein n=1 Tax=Halocynthiibacter styelae TaxID=2761955 RepID=A0A8J7IC41_9RHOB|nr:hypothetical protein [Paenihalocynthiibacter styelae]MBI1492883.1 hypothetical protein [Paenihalocynthiibacter styelae]
MSLKFRMMICLLCLHVIAACSGPGVQMTGVQGQKVTVQGSAFTVYTRGDHAQAVRTGFEFPARISDIFPKAAIAIEQVSGCSVRPSGMSGDAALIRAKLDCG